MMDGLTDNRGRTVNFSNAVIIMTGNIGSELLAEPVGDEDMEIPESVRGQIMERLKAHFRPEFLNRLDEVVLFSMLNKRADQRDCEAAAGGPEIPPEGAGAGAYGG